MSGDNTVPEDERDERRRVRRRRWRVEHRAGRVINRLRWPITAALAVVAFGLGFYGYGHVAGYGSFVDRLCATVSLFQFKASGTPPFPATIEVARLLAPAPTAYVVFRASVALFNEQFSRWRVRWFARDHVIVCGLGRCGSRLARSFNAEGYVVVVIDHTPSAADLAECREQRIRVVRGDANDAEILRLTRVDRARYLMVACGDDSVNSEVAVLAGTLPRHHGRLECFVHIADEALCRLLREADLGAEGHVSISYFNVYDEGPRAVFGAYPFPDDAPVPPQVVIAGSGAIRTNLVLEACRRWVVTDGLSGRRLSVAVLNPGAVDDCRALQERHPGLDRVCDLRPWPSDPADADTELTTAPFPEGLAETVSVFVYEDDDTTALRSSMRVRKVLPQAAHVVALTPGRSGVARLLSGSSTDAFSHVESLPLLDRVCVSGIVLNGLGEYVAQAIHANYVARTRQRDPNAQGPALVGWERLDPTYQQANRDQARDIRNKLLLAGYDMAPASWTDPPVVTFPPEVVEFLAEIEHQRWMADRLRDGWRYGAHRDNRRKLHSSLVGWEELSEEERQKDRDAVEDIPGLLAKAGLVVVPGAGSPLPAAPVDDRLGRAAAPSQ